MTKRVQNTLVYTLIKKLSFKTHIGEIKSKLKKHYCFYQYKNRFRRDTLIKLYKIYVQPVLQYGVLIYNCAGKSELKQLNWSQNHNQDNIRTEKIQQRPRFQREI